MQTALQLNNLIMESWSTPTTLHTQAQHTNGYMNQLPRYIACATHRLTLTSATLIHSLLKSRDITAALAPLCMQHSASTARNSDIIRVPSILRSFLSLCKFGALLSLNLSKFHYCGSVVRGDKNVSPHGLANADWMECRKRGLRGNPVRERSTSYAHSSLLSNSAFFDAHIANARSPHFAQRAFFKRSSEIGHRYTVVELCAV